MKEFNYSILTDIQNKILSLVYNEYKLAQIREELNLSAHEINAEIRSTCNRVKNRCSSFNIVIDNEMILFTHFLELKQKIYPLIQVLDFLEFNHESISNDLNDAEIEFRKQVAEFHKQMNEKYPNIPYGKFDFNRLYIL